MISVYFIISNILFVAVNVLVFALPRPAKIQTIIPIVVVTALVEIIFLLKHFLTKKRSASTISALVYALLIVWIVTTRFGLSHPVLVPFPENVFNIFVTNRKDLIEGFFSSMKILFLGISIAMILGIFLGLFIGYIQGLRETFLPITKVLSTIPPLVYTPYVVAVMPTFYSASIFVIFSAVFWPTFMSMIARVGSIDKKIIDSARGMNVSTPTMLFKIIVPYSLPEVIARLSTSLTSAMLCLTGAEMLGASAGLGYFVKKFSDYADYTRVLAGIIYIAIIVTILNILVELLQKKVIKWRY
jgi:NitT/TauT family transport system permease protein